MTQVPILPPPWGPRVDPHFDAVLRYEGFGHHEQATARDALEKGWWFRSEWYKQLVPDTRRCRIHGEIMFTELTITENELYRFQAIGMATGPIG